ncbi:MAG TPA: hypothetical protein VM098_04175 [Phycisphaerae bacterium]|nr:hypothetical protein [Phycisphaerae bacterium]
MQLLYKENWEATKQRYRAWWAGENFGRCGLWVTAPRARPMNVPPPPPRPATPEQRWTDLDYISAYVEHAHATTFFGGEALPVWQAGYPGHKNLPAFLGCRVELDFNTGWVRPMLNGEAIDCTSLTLDESNDRCQYALREQAHAVRQSRDKSIPAIAGAFGGSGDTLAWLRGTERLLIDIMDRPDEVLAAEMHLMGLWIQVYDRFYNMIRQAAEGSTTWYPLWAPGKFYAPQNDFAYMISPAHFRKLFLPGIEKQLQYLDYTIYHVDGVGNFNHVDTLLELPKLHALQILPGAGKPSALHYMPVLKKVQAAGKNLDIFIGPDEVAPALRELSARGLFIHTWCRTEDEAKDLLKKAERWSHDRTVVPAARAGDNCPLP